MIKNNNLTSYQIASRRCRRSRTADQARALPWMQIAAARAALYRLRAASMRPRACRDKRLSLFSGIFQRIVSCPMDFQWHFPMDFHICDFWCVIFCPRPAGPAGCGAPGRGTCAGRGACGSGPGYYYYYYYYYY